MGYALPFRAIQIIPPNDIKSYPYGHQCSCHTKCVRPIPTSSEQCDVELRHLLRLSDWLRYLPQRRKFSAHAYLGPLTFRGCFNHVCSDQVHAIWDKVALGLIAAQTLHL